MNADYIPDFVPWTYDGMSYDVVEVQQANNNSGITDVDMTDGGDGSGDGGGDQGWKAIPAITVDRTNQP